MRLIRSLSVLALAIACLAIASPAGAQSPLRVGDHFPIHITADGDSDVEPTQTRDGKVFRLTHPGATYMAIHFDDIKLVPGSKIRISDGNGGQSYNLRGRGKMEAGRFWSQHVKGDTIVIHLFTRGPQDGGFVIDEYVAGFVDLGDATESICGTDDKENAVCYATSHPTEYARAQAVARLLIQGSSLCTGWLASATDHLVTNEHCITSATAALNTDYEFAAEAPGCNDANCQLCHTGVIFSGAAFIQDSAALDYALVQINSGNPAATYGFLEIDNRDAVIGEEIYQPAHPGGRAKEMGILSTHDDDQPGGVCHVVSVTEPGCSSGAPEVGYYCDTEGGSSGSPILARSSHKVIALHHCRGNNFCPSNTGGDPNRGVPIDDICTEICGFLGPECTVDLDCADSNPCTADTCDAGTCNNTPLADCCGNGTCETGEDCNSCAVDCPSTGGGTPGVCGNNVCEPAFGEDCLSCASDCNGKQNGKPGNRYCCGAGGGENPVDCTDARCTGGGNTCGSVDPGTCCGDLVCDPGEECSCEIDCGAAPGSETSCSDGVDNDCDGLIDCADTVDCPAGIPECPTCGQKNDPCSSNSDCCSLSCKPNGRCR